MKILVDISHPAHVHLFKNFGHIMLKKGHTLLYTARDKEYEEYLLEAFNLDYICLGKHYQKTRGKIWGLIKYTFQLIIINWRFRADIMLSHGSVYAAVTSWIYRKPHISLEDSGNMEQIRLYRPFTKVILTPDVLEQNLGVKQIRYNSYHELAYLVPEYFEPDQNFIDRVNPGGKHPYIVLRFVSWKATHDKNQTGLDNDTKLELVGRLSDRMKIFISSESELPESLRDYCISAPPDKMHDILAGASLYIGEGATMAAEAGVLGVPSIYVNSIKRCYNEDQEKYGLLYNFRNSERVIEKALELINDPEIHIKWEKKRIKMFREKMDLTSLLVWFVENYPESNYEIRTRPELLKEFKISF